MQKTFYAEVTLLTLLSTVLLFLLNPFDMMMQIMLSVGVVALLVILYITKFIIIWREKDQDERDASHRFYSSWVSYAVTSVLLFVGIVVEGLSGNVNTWLIIAFSGLLISKLCALVYLRIYK